MCISKQIKWIKKINHRKKIFFCIFFQSLHQVDMKNIVGCPREFIAYFNALETTCDLFTTLFLPLSSSKPNVTENSFKKYNKFTNSKLLNWPKTAQIYFYSVTPSYMRLHTGLLKCFVLNNLCTPKHLRTLYKALFLRPWSVSIQGAQGVGHWLPWDPLEIHVLRMWWVRSF